MGLFNRSTRTRRAQSCRLSVNSLDERINPGATSCTPEPPVCPPPPTCQPPAPPKPCNPGDNGNHYGQDKCKVKGNNGVGNGLDPQPPGNPPVNDGAGTEAGLPGNRGGANK